MHFSKNIHSWCMYLHAVAVAVVSLVCLCVSCGTDPAQLIKIKGWMDEMEFSEDGSCLLSIHGHVRHTGAVHSDTVVVHSVGGWNKLMEYTSQGRIRTVCMCADPDIVVHSESDEVFGGIDDLVFRSISSKEIVNRIVVDHLPGQSSNLGVFYCDMEDNKIYANILQDKISVLDGSTGETMSEYEVPTAGSRTIFSVQKVHDRLIAIDFYDDIIWIYRISTGELLGRIDIWPSFRDSDLPVECRFIDDDHVLYLLAASKEGKSGVYSFLVDLVSGSVENECLLPEYIFWEAWIMERGGDRVLANVNKPSEYNGSTIVMNFRTCDVEHELDLSWHGQGQVFPIPEIGRIYIDDWRAPNDSSARIYGYPELDLLHEGRAPNDSEEKQWVSDGQFIVMESYFDNRFGIYDPVKLKVKDDFYICEDVAGNSLRIDATQRWAAVMCRGKNPDGKFTSDSYPKGAGISVVDLDNYR